MIHAASPENPLRVPSLRSTRCKTSRVIERSDFADHFANLEKAAGVEFGVSPLHRLQMLGMGAPGFQGLFGGESEYGYLFAVIGLEGLDRLKARKLADDAVHALAQFVVLVLRCALAQFQVSDNEHLVDHFLSLAKLDAGTLPALLHESGEDTCRAGAVPVLKFA